MSAVTYTTWGLSTGNPSLQIAVRSIRITFLRKECMTSLLFEQPWLIGSIGAVLTIVTLYGWLQSGNQLALRSSAGIFASTLALLALNIGVTTYAEEVYAWADDAAKELRNNEREKVMARIHPSCSPMVENCISRMYSVTFSDFRVTKIHGVEIANEGEDITAIARMNVVAEASAEGQYREFKGKAARWIQLKMIREQGYWQVIDLEERDAQHEFIWTRD
jgi:hypothetical protein